MSWIGNKGMKCDTENEGIFGRTEMEKNEAKESRLTSIQALRAWAFLVFFYLMLVHLLSGLPSE